MFEGFPYIVLFLEPCIAPRSLSTFNQAIVDANNGFWSERWSYAYCVILTR